MVNSMFLLMESLQVSKQSHSVPQGSSLGLLLFLLYINVLQCMFSKSLTFHFAEDTYLVFSSKGLGSIESESDYFNG